MRRPRDWLRQADLDLAYARDARADGHHEWACFAAQQAADKAVKALHESEGNKARGDSVAELLRGLAGVPGNVLDCATALDEHYIRARYLSAHPVGAPGDRYTTVEADGALRHADVVIEYVRSGLSPAPTIK